MFTLIIAFSVSTVAFAQVASNLEQGSKSITQNINDTDLGEKIPSFEFIDENGVPLENVKIIEFNQNDSSDDYKATYEIRQNVPNSNDSKTIEPQDLVVATATMSVEKLSDRKYRVNYNFICTHIMTQIDLVVYKDYPYDYNPAKRTVLPKARTYSGSVDLDYVSTGTYTVKVLGQVCTTSGWLANVVSAGTRTIAILE